jgi:hypothetical protein
MKFFLFLFKPLRELRFIKGGAVGGLIESLDCARLDSTGFNECRGILLFAVLLKH